ncbi:Cytochrome c oxidase subunit 6 [Xanthoria calcicola]
MDSLPPRREADRPPIPPEQQPPPVSGCGRINWLTNDLSRRGNRYEKEFDAVQDVFELQRNLNNAFAYDLVPSPSVITAALRAARRVNDYPTAVRIFEGIKAKVENQGQYEEYLDDLKPLREELGVNLKEDLYPEPAS